MEIKLKELRARGVKVKKDKGIVLEDDNNDPPFLILLRFSFNDEDCLWVPRELREAPDETIVTFDEHPGQEYTITFKEDDLSAGNWILHTSIRDLEEEAAAERWDD